MRTIEVGINDFWTKSFIKEAQKKPDVTKEELEQWLEYCYKCSIEYRMMTDLDRFFTQGPFFTRCYLTVLKLLEKE